MRNLLEKVGSPGNKLRFESVNVEFFVVKDWLHLGVITENNIIYNALYSITADFEHEDEHVHEHERTAYFATASS